MRDEPRLHCISARRRKIRVVVFGADIVGMSANLGCEPLVDCEQRQHLLEDGLRIRSQRRLVEVEIYTIDLDHARCWRRPPSSSVSKL